MVEVMPRQARLDAPGALHHVIGRGIERTKIFRSGKDRADFVNRVETLAKSGAWKVYAWALMDNHFHLLIRTGNRHISQSMRKLLTGYVVNFNLRHKRHGHLFQNRYRSILCEEDAYLLELIRYIHLNPLRAGIVHTLDELAKYPWSGHGAIVGSREREWLDVGGILSHFGDRKGKAIRAYEEFLKAGIPLGKRPELTGGGLIRSMGGWSAVLSARRKVDQPAWDQRILGSGEFIEEVWRKTDNQTKDTLRGRGKIISLADLLRKVAREEGVGVEEIRGGDRRSKGVKTRRQFCEITVKELGFSGAAVARLIGVATSTVSRYLGMGRNVPG